MRRRSSRPTSGSSSSIIRTAKAAMRSAPPRSTAPIASCGREPATSRSRSSSTRIWPAAPSRRRAWVRIAALLASRGRIGGLVLLAAGSLPSTTGVGSARGAGRAAARSRPVCAGRRWTSRFISLRSTLSAEQALRISPNERRDGARQRQPRLPPRTSQQSEHCSSSTAARRSTMPWSSSRIAIRCATRGRSASLR